MSRDLYIPKTLTEAIVHYSNEENAFELVVALRWANGVTCPRCECSETTFVSTRRIWKCKGCKRQFSVKVGTIFEDSPLPLGTWLSAIWLISNAKNGISSYEIMRALGVTQKSAWFMLHRIRLALESGSFEKLSGTVEIDETFIGGKISNRHMKERVNSTRGGPKGKAIVMGFLERDGRAHALVAKNVKAKTLFGQVTDNVEPGSTIYTDNLQSYRSLSSHYTHEVVSHLNEWVRGEVHTNGIENFWSLFKRCYKGTYVHMNVDHLSRYVSEQLFRFNNRKGTDGTRFVSATLGVFDKRLTYTELKGG